MYQSGILRLYVMKTMKWYVVVLVIKGGGYLLGMGIVETLFNIIDIIINGRL